MLRTSGVCAPPSDGNHKKYHQVIEKVHPGADVKGVVPADYLPDQQGGQPEGKGDDHLLCTTSVRWQFEISLYL